MSAVELAVKRVKRLSDRQARELLAWLAKRPSNGTAKKARKPSARRKSKRPRTMREIMAWYDSIRGSTDWEPPRMPDDLVKPTRLL
jgi:hypothetical protein